VRRRRARPELAFIGPANGYLALVTLFPLLYTAWLSLYRWNIPFPRHFIRLGNYATALQDPLFWYSVRITLWWAIATSVAEVVLGLGIAQLLNRHSRWVHLARSLVIVPMVLTPVVTAMMWRYIYNPTLGPLNWLLGLAGIAPREWYSDPATVWPSLFLIDLWQWTPFVVVIVLSGLYALPSDVYESADIDGAGSWSKFWRLTLPLLSPVLLIALLLRLVESLKIFDTIYVLTRGGPGTLTEVLSFHIYRMGVGERFQVGYGASMSLLFLVLATVPVVILILRARNELGLS
jgi:multiple sugar transport system permease protein